MRRLLVALTLLVPRLASAEECSVSVSTQTASVGQPVVVQLVCETNGGATPSNPRLDVKGAAEKSGPSIGTSSSIRMHNFSVQRSQSTSFTWTVYGNAPGELTIGPASVQTSNGAFRSGTTKIRVLKEGDPNARVGRSRDPFPFDPFDFMRGRAPPVEEALPTPVPELSIEKPRSEPLFAHAILSTNTAVIGEPVHVRLYVYSNAGPFDAAPNKIPSPTDFLSFPVEIEPPYPIEIADVGGTLYRAVKIFDAWLVPLHAGKFNLGRFQIVARAHSSFRSSPRELKSENLVITVSEPPKAGRPVGYKLGDVGVLSLQAEVTPRELTDGDFFEVRATVSGDGALPSTLILPEDPRVEWQEPRVQGGPKATQEHLNGARTLTLSGKVKGAGPLRLGELTLPYFDLKSRSYATLRAALGDFQVLPGRTASSAAVSAPSPANTSTSAGDSATLVQAHLRKNWTTVSAPPSLRWIEALWLAPLFAGASLVVRRTWSRLTPSRASRKKKNELPKPKGFGHVAELLRSGENTAALKSLEELLIYAAMDHLGENLRGIARHEWRSTLEKLGVTEALATRLQTTALALVEARYSSQSTHYETLVSDVRELVSELEREGKKKR